VHFPNTDSGLVARAGATAWNERGRPSSDYPTLTAQDLANAWAYVRSHRDEIEEEIEANEEQSLRPSR
jgi:hypothetical protein